MAKLSIEIVANNMTGAAFRTLKGDINDLERSIHGANKSAGLFKAGMIAAASAAGAAVVASGAAMAKTVADGVQESAKLQAQISNAIAKAKPEEQTQANMDALKQQAIDLGKNPRLKVAVNEVADIQEMLIAQGVDVVDVIGQQENSITQHAIAFANATGGTFELGAKVMGDSMNIFGINAKEMGAVVDGATGAINQSKLTMQDYAYAIANGGGAWKSAGGELSDLNGILVAGANYFSSGQTLGNGVKSMAAGFVPATDKARKLSEALGLDFFDAEGNMKSAVEVAGELNRVFYGLNETTTTTGGLNAEQAKELERLNGIYAKAKQTVYDYDNGLKGLGEGEEKRNKTIAEQQAVMKNAEAAMKPYLAITGKTITSIQKMTEEERLYNLKTIFGQRGMILAGALAQYDEAAMAKLIEQVNQQGLAADSAAIRTANLSSAWENFQDVWLATKITIGDAYLPALERMVRSLSVVVAEAAPMIERLLTAPADWLMESVAPAFEQFAANLEEGRIELGLDTIIGKMSYFEDWSGRLGGTLKKINIGELFNFEQLTTATGIKGTWNLSNFITADWDTILSGASSSFKLNIGDIISFENMTGFGDSFKSALKLTWGDIITGTLTWDSTGLTTLNINDWITGSFDWNTHMSKLVIGDVIEWAGTELAGKLTLTMGGTEFTLDTSVLQANWDTFAAQVQTAYSQGGMLAVGPAIIQGLVDGMNSSLETGSVVVPEFVNIGAGVVTDMINQLHAEAIKTFDTTLTGEEDSPLKKIADTIGETFTALGTGLDNLDGAKLAETFNSITGLVTTLNVAIGGEKTTDWDGLTSGITGLVTGLTGVATEFIAGVNTDTLAMGIKMNAMRLGAIIQSAFDVTKMTEVGTAIGGFVGQLSTKVGEFLGAPEFGTTLGENVAKATGAFTAGAAALITGIVNQMSTTNWGVVSSQVGMFTGGFIDAITASLGAQDWGGIGQTIADKIQGAINLITGKGQADLNAMKPQDLLMTFANQRLDTEKGMPLNQQQDYRDETLRIMARLAEQGPEQARGMLKQMMDPFGGSMAQFMQARIAGSGQEVPDNVSNLLKDVGLGVGGVLRESAQTFKAINDSGVVTIAQAEVNIPSSAELFGPKLPPALDLKGAPGSTERMDSLTSSLASTLDPLGRVIPEAATTLNAAANALQTTAIGWTLKAQSPPAQLAAPTIAQGDIKMDLSGLSAAPVEIPVKPVIPPGELETLLALPKPVELKTVPLLDWKTVNAAMQVAPVEVPVTVNAEAVKTQVTSAWGGVATSLPKMIGPMEAPKPEDMPEWKPYPEWKWTSYPTFTWPDPPKAGFEAMPKFSWPPMPTMAPPPRPGWLNSLLSWTPPPISLPAGGGTPAGGAPTGKPLPGGGRALGGPLEPGLWRVGEFGPETLAVGGRGHAYNARETEAMMQPSVNVTVNASVANEIDKKQLAYEIAREINRHVRR